MHRPPVAGTCQNSPVSQGNPNFRVQCSPGCAGGTINVCQPAQGGNCAQCAISQPFTNGVCVRNLPGTGGSDVVVTCSARAGQITALLPTNTTGTTADAGNTTELEEALTEPEALTDADM